MGPAALDEPVARRSMAGDAVDGPARGDGAGNADVAFAVLNMAGER